MGELIISREEAKARGLTRYFTGKQCRHRHVAERFTSNGACLICLHVRNDADRERNNKRKAANIARKRAADPEKAREAERAYCRANPEKRAALKAKYYWQNPEAMRAQSRAKYHANPEYSRAYAKAWRAANPEHAKHLHRQHKARRRGAPGRHTKKDVAEIYALQKGKCACCRVKLGDTFDVDHIQPIAKGGSNARSNLQILCRPCNQRKSAKDPLDFSRELGLLL